MKFNNHMTRGKETNLELILKTFVLLGQRQTILDGIADRVDVALGNQIFAGADITVWRVVIIVSFVLR